MCLSSSVSEVVSCCMSTPGSLTSQACLKQREVGQKTKEITEMLASITRLQKKLTKKPNADDEPKFEEVGGSLRRWSSALEAVLRLMKACTVAHPLQKQLRPSLLRLTSYTDSAATAITPMSVCGPAVSESHERVACQS